MRNLTTNYSFTAGTRAITVAGEPFTVENIRLIVNETQKKVLCSSMQKDFIVSVVDNVITYSNSLPALVAGDKLTIELDNGVLPVFSANEELAEGKALIADNLTTMGVAASGSESLISLGNKVLSAGVNVTVTPVVNYPSVWHDLFAVMASVYDASKPYMYALLITRDTPQDILNSFTDGEVVSIGGDADAGKITKYVVFKRATQVFNASYNANFKNYLLGCAAYNADMLNVSFYGSFLSFMFYNADYSVSKLAFNLSQFQATKLTFFVTPNVAEIQFPQNNAFYGANMSYVILQSAQTGMTISGANTWYGCTSLTTFTFPQSLTSLTISGIQTWQNCSSLTTLSFPNCRDYFSCVAFGGTFTSLITIILGAGWKWTFATSASTVQSHDSIVANFAALIDKRADGVNPTTVTSATNSPIITGVNSQFTKVFVGGIGQTISIDGGANLTILSVDSDTQLTLTTNSNKTGSGLSYNIQKTLTLGATNLARVSSAEIAVGTNKGWTIN